MTMQVGGDNSAAQAAEAAVEMDTDAPAWIHVVPIEEAFYMEFLDAPSLQRLKLTCHEFADHPPARYQYCFKQLCAGEWALPSRPLVLDKSGSVDRSWENFYHDLDPMPVGFQRDLCPREVELKADKEGRLRFASLTEGFGDDRCCVSDAFLPNIFTSSVVAHPHKSTTPNPPATPAPPPPTRTKQPLAQEADALMADFALFTSRKRAQSHSPLHSDRASFERAMEEGADGYRFVAGYRVAHYYEISLHVGGGNDKGCVRGNGHSRLRRRLNLVKRDDAPLPVECVSVGLATRQFNPNSKQAGWDNQSWGWHGDDGHLFHGSGSRGVDWTHKFGIGDIVGCGIVYVFEGDPYIQPQWNLRHDHRQLTIPQSFDLFWRSNPNNTAGADEDDNDMAEGSGEADGQPRPPVKSPWQVLAEERASDMADFKAATERPIVCGVDERGVLRKVAHRQIFYTLNGEYLGPAFDLATDEPLLACVGVDCSCTIEINFGAKPFKFDVDAYFPPMSIPPDARTFGATPDAPAASPPSPPARRFIRRLFDYPSLGPPPGPKGPPPSPPPPPPQPPSFFPGGPSIKRKDQGASADLAAVESRVRLAQLLAVRAERARQAGRQRAARARLQKMAEWRRERDRRSTDAAQQPPDSTKAQPAAASDHNDRLAEEAPKPAAAPTAAPAAAAAAAGGGGGAEKDQASPSGWSDSDDEEAERPEDRHQAYFAELEATTWARQRAAESRPCFQLIDTVRGGPSQRRRHRINNSVFGCITDNKEAKPDSQAAASASASAAEASSASAAAAGAVEGGEGEGEGVMRDISTPGQTTERRETSYTETRSLVPHFNPRLHLRVWRPFAAGQERVLRHFNADVLRSGEVHYPFHPLADRMVVSVDRWQRLVDPAHLTPDPPLLAYRNTSNSGQIWNMRISLPGLLHPTIGPRRHWERGDAAARSVSPSPTATPATTPSPQLQLYHVHHRPLFGHLMRMTPIPRRLPRQEDALPPVNLSRTMATVVLIVHVLTIFFLHAYVTPHPLLRLSEAQGDPYFSHQELTPLSRLPQVLQINAPEDDDDNNENILPFLGRGGNLFTRLMARRDMPTPPRRSLRIQDRTEQQQQQEEAEASSDSMEEGESGSNENDENGGDGGEGDESDEVGEGGQDEAADGPEADGGDADDGEWEPGSGGDEW
ncbi:unnamed protein product [Vitrella brassicaformis CCMP3155]|uniref:SPRY domain-containing protein n=3 Tax=Vitrella brassicaformis TaxID=1169539 RepID=A0A0G4G2H9_VITBC|nr:unnamed protein product [Vitrella brassicaformis CCMP3155]|eukprot:CEM22484.1 unnamed protein product [Vitrella brassicaformis CCMP3155]